MAINKLVLTDNWSYEDKVTLLTTICKAHSF